MRIKGGVPETTQWRPDSLYNSFMQINVLCIVVNEKRTHPATASQIKAGKVLEVLY